MSQVLKYGVPGSDRLVCDNPVCEELATHLLTVVNGSGDATQPTKEICACPAHLEHLMGAYQLQRFRRLRVPGERDRGEAP